MSRERQVWVRLGRGGRIVSVARTRPYTRDDAPVSGQVSVQRIPEAALDAALRLADGDASRLRFHDDGSVTVANAPRSVGSEPAGWRRPAEEQ